MRSLLRAAEWVHELALRIATSFAVSFVLCATLAIAGYTVLGIIEERGGEIEVKARSASGTTFVVRLPGVP